MSALDSFFGEITEVETQAKKQKTEEVIERELEAVKAKRSIPPPPFTTQSKSAYMPLSFDVPAVPINKTPTVYASHSKYLPANTDQSDNKKEDDSVPKFKLFVGNLDSDVKHHELAKCFEKYTSFESCDIIGAKNRHEDKSKVYGFVTFSDPIDCATALRKENGKFCQSRPMQLKKANINDSHKEERNNGKKDKKRKDKDRH